jgi:hypothetical protein
VKPDPLNLKAADFSFDPIEIKKTNCSEDGNLGFENIDV